MEDTGDDSVESEDPHEWCTEKVVTFLRSLGTAECFHSPGDHVMQLGVDVSVFFGLSVNELEGIHTYCVGVYLRDVRELLPVCSTLVKVLYSLMKDLLWETKKKIRSPSWGNPVREGGDYLYSESEFEFESVVK